HPGGGLPLRRTPRHRRHLVASMWILATLLFAAALGLALRRLQLQHRALAALNDALNRRRPVLRDEVPGALGDDFETLRTACNELVAEVRQLEHLRQGQLFQLEATLGNVQEAVLIIDAGNRVVLANRALQAIFPRARNIVDQRLET